MEKISKTVSINYRENKSLNTIDYNYSARSLVDNSPKHLKKEEAEAIIAQVSDLIDDQAFKPFFFKQLYKLGGDEFLAIADTIRSGKYEYPGRKFASSLKYKRRYR